LRLPPDPPSRTLPPSLPPLPLVLLLLHTCGARQRRRGHKKCLTRGSQTSEEGKESGDGRGRRGGSTGGHGQVAAAAAAEVEEGDATPSLLLVVGGGGDCDREGGREGGREGYLRVCVKTKQGQGQQQAQAAAALEACMRARAEAERRCMGQRK